MSEESQISCTCVIGKDYPAPIVDLKETRNRAHQHSNLSVKVKEKIAIMARISG